MDRYYTPEPLARELLAQCGSLRGADRVVDPSCGSGALLSAAEFVLDGPRCLGIDVDRATIRSLRTKKPHWYLSVANLLSARSVRGSLVGRTALASDVVLLNPPFSQVKTKFVEYVSPCGSQIRVGRAMRFLLQAVDLFPSAQGMFAIVPESLVYSELDAKGRKLLGLQYEMREIAALKSTTFSGARVRSIAVEFRRNAHSQASGVATPPPFTSIRFERGTLPVHLAQPVECGFPFVHSSDLLAIARRQFPEMRVCSGRYAISGWALFLPRVGLPKRAALKPVYVRSPFRLSDCVLAIWCNSCESTSLIKKLIDDSWEDFLGLYRGTGARYVTVSRLSAWLVERGVAVQPA